jgi:hypothetical protein
VLIHPFFAGFGLRLGRLPGVSAVGGSGSEKCTDIPATFASASQNPEASRLTLSREGYKGVFGQLAAG